MQVGSLVQYTPREGEEPSPAIIMRIWPEGTIELHVFHFESATHIRSAHPSQVKPVVDASQIEEILSEFETLGQRLNDLESELEEIRRTIRSTKPDAGSPQAPSEPVPVDASLLDFDLGDNPTVEHDHDSGEQTFFPETTAAAASGAPSEAPVESTSKRKGRSAWPH